MYIILSPPPIRPGLASILVFLRSYISLYMYFYPLSQCPSFHDHKMYLRNEITSPVIMQFHPSSCYSFSYTVLRLGCWLHKPTGWISCSQLTDWLTDWLTSSLKMHWLIKLSKYYGKVTEQNMWKINKLIKS
jgi:hypothetical protein